MSRLPKRLLMLSPMVIAFGLGIFLYQGIGQDPNNTESSLIGQSLPSFTSQTLMDEGKVVTLKDMIGQPALVNVWATWCPTCKAEHEFLNTIAAQENVRIFGVNYHDQRDAAKQWLTDLGNPYVFSVFDPKGSLGINLGVVGAPETYLIDAKGLIIDKVTGELNERTWLQLKDEYHRLVKEHEDG